MPHCSRREFTASLSLAAAATAVRGAAAAADDPLASLTLAQASEKIRTRAVSPSELVKACLDRIEVYNPKLNAFITVTRASALAEAKALEAEQRAGKLRSPLHGIPIALKDNIDTAGVRIEPPVSVPSAP